VQNIFGEAAERAVKSLFNIIGESTGRQFVEFKMIGNTLAALTLSRTGFIGAIAFSFVVVYIAFHENNL